MISTRPSDGKFSAASLILYIYINCICICKIDPQRFEEIRLKISSFWRRQLANCLVALLDSDWLVVFYSFYGHKMHGICARRVPRLFGQVLDYFLLPFKRRPEGLPKPSGISKGFLIPFSLALPTESSRVSWSISLHVWAKKTIFFLIFLEAAQVFPIL
jgi:hypothetical protein